MKNLLLLPSASLIPPELQTEFGEISSAMVPLDNRPALQYIIEPYLAKGFHSAIAVNESDHQVKNYLLRHPELKGTAIAIKQTNSLGETIIETFKKLSFVPKQLVINFADTFVGDNIKGENVICYYNQSDVYRWTTFTFNRNLELLSISEKNKPKDAAGVSPVFVGVFFIKDYSVFSKLLEGAVKENALDIDPFYLAIKTYFNGLKRNQKRITRITDWRDFGHLDTYYATKRSFFLKKRFFNDVVVDNSRGIIKKTSREIKKFVNEIRWYLKLPKDIQYIAPRVFNYSLNTKKPFVELEFYGYPVLSDIYLFGNFNLGVWSQIFTAIEYVIKDMGRFECKGEQSSFRKALIEIYEKKTYNRLKIILSDPQFDYFCSDKIFINNKETIGLKKILKILPKTIKEFKLLSDVRFTIIHGDLCLSNILYDRRNRFIRTVDPRGEFGKYDIYGDQRYDLAKLCHSLEGDYDFINNGLFSSHFDSKGFSYHVFINENQKLIKNYFSHWFNDRWGESSDQIRLIEGLLFLSLVPLHKDRFKAQQVFLARGLQILDGLLNH